MINWPRYTLKHPLQFFFFFSNYLYILSNLQLMNVAEQVHK